MRRPRTPQAIGDIRKMIVHDGHQGPKEIGCSPDFLEMAHRSRKRMARVLCMILGVMGPT